MSITPLTDRTRRAWRGFQYAILAAIILSWLNILGILTPGHHYPPKATTTLDQLVADRPNTYKIAVVEEGNRTYVVWVGRVPGVLVSGPPVYVFDRTGSLVDRVGDSGDSNKQFVRELHAAALKAPGITPQEALAYCRKWRAGTPRSGNGSPNRAGETLAPGRTPGANPEL